MHGSSVLMDRDLVPGVDRVFARLLHPSKSEFDEVSSNLTRDRNSARDVSVRIRAGEGRTRPVGRTALTDRKGIRLRAQATSAANASSVQT